MSGPLNIEEHEALRGYLQSGGSIDSADEVSFADLKGGVSCRTVLVRRSNGQDIVVKQALEFLRVAEVWRGDPARVEREAEAMRVLAEILAPGQVPTLLFEDRNEHLIAMSAVPAPHENWKHMLLRGEVQPHHVQQFAQMLGAMHRVSSERPSEFIDRFGDRSQFETLRVDPYYRFSASIVPALAGWFNTLIEETARSRVALVHGDFSPKNILIHEDACVLLDHEVAHWGDPAFDVGFATAHFLGKANHVDANLFGGMAQLFWSTYREEVGDCDWFDEARGRAVRHSIACVLARVCGKSPLEYLSDGERQRQRQAAILLADDEPGDQSQLIQRFVGEII